MEKEYIKHHTTDFINRIFIYLPYYCNDNMGDILLYMIDIITYIIHTEAARRIYPG
ncbi:hypothetical protein HMPREF2531_03236 [Bacteroides intestinalis]|uniref:Uncharacterized protein n=1 Tax=Bacteroides intestinalis TaxID=329854 RepID=A0A139L3P2_9BACE|nr:hypothetical protein HMPREF2531_03236 [Bacteroides intestinalis]